MRKQFSYMNQGVSTIKYNLAMKKLFSDRSKFKVVKEDLNLTF